MPDNKPGLAFLDEAIAIAGQFNALIPVTVFAAKQLYALMKRDNPSLTPEQYYEYLRTQGREVKAFSAAWLTAHGYTQDAAGGWHPPA